MSPEPAIKFPPPDVLHDIDWRLYSRLLRAFEIRRVRLTYDRGTLEIVSPEFQHESLVHRLSACINVLTEELNLPVRGGGSVTLRRRRYQRGVDPDSCFWIGSVQRMLGRQDLDLRSDPPPDLVVEVDVPNRLLNRMSIFAALGVPEVWRLSADELICNVLVAGRYQVRAHSVAFSRLASADLAPFLDQQGQTDDTSIVRQFREWVRQKLCPGAAPFRPLH